MITTVPTEWLPPQAPGGAPPPRWRAPEDETPAFEHPRFAPPTAQAPAPAPSAGVGRPAAATPPAGVEDFTAVRETNGPATASLVLGICGVVLFLFDGFGLIFVLNLPCSVAAWIYGRRAMQRIDRGETPAARGTARAGLVLGVVGTLLGGAALVAWILVYALGGRSL